MRSAWASSWGCELDTGTRLLGTSWRVGAFITREGGGFDNKRGCFLGAFVTVLGRVLQRNKQRGACVVFIRNWLLGLQAGPLGRRPPTQVTCEGCPPRRPGFVLPSGLQLAA